ncbi:MAG TPA: sugar phosphate isomerase/epimerase [Bryobacteraceae bacterium]|nr:sugar phosphate isomerase/epimerase [Bryobacteraceae bacterium]
MTSRDSISRRSLLALAAAAPFASVAANNDKIPIGLELYSVRDELKKDEMGTVRAVAKMGYEDVEFYAPYYDWTPEHAKEVRKLLDDLGIKCYSTHNGPQSFSADGIQRAIDLNGIIGSRYIVLASAGRVKDLDGWKRVADMLNTGAEKMKPSGLKPGYHNHQLEFTVIGGKRPMEVLAQNTSKDVMLQLDVGHAIQTGADPVAWINQNPGRIRSLHLKDWSPDPEKGLKVLFGEGAVPWKQIFQAAETTGGVEFYLIEQEGSNYPPIETAERCLALYRKIHG